MTYCEAHLERTGQKIPAVNLGLCDSCFKGGAIRPFELRGDSEGNTGSGRAVRIKSGMPRNYTRPTNSIRAQVERLMQDMELEDERLLCFPNVPRDTVRTAAMRTARDRGIDITTRAVNGNIYVKRVQG